MTMAGHADLILVGHIYGYLPTCGIVPLQQIADDLEELPETIAGTLRELADVGALDCTITDTHVDIVAKDEEEFEIFVSCVSFGLPPRERESA
jgi:hypothetical protein